MGSPELAVCWAKVWGAWAPYLQLMSEVGAVLWD